MVWGAAAPPRVVDLELRPEVTAFFGARKGSRNHLRRKYHHLIQKVILSPNLEETYQVKSIFCSHLVNFDIDAIYINPTHPKCPIENEIDGAINTYPRSCLR